MENIVVNVMIAATSNKISDRYKRDVYTKTVFLQADSKNSKLLEDFGLRKYTSTKDNTEFYQLQCSRDVLVYTTQDPKEEPITLCCVVKDVNHPELEPTCNFNSNEEIVSVNIIRAENSGNNFVRLQAIMAPNGITFVKPQNPFSGNIS